MWVVYAAAAAALVVGVMYAASDVTRGWLESIWDRWFRKSHVMAAADAVTVAGLAIAYDPDFLTVVGEVFKDYPIVVPALGVALRALRNFRDSAVTPLKK